MLAGEKLGGNGKPRVPAPGVMFSVVTKACVLRWGMFVVALPLSDRPFLYCMLNSDAYRAGRTKIVCSPFFLSLRRVFYSA